MSAAAGDVHLSQPAASRALQGLEEELGVALFDRVGRRLVLSAAGRAYLPRARSILEALDGAAREVEKVAKRGYHDVRIGTVDSIGTYVMPAVLPAIRDEFEGLGVKLLTSRTADLLARLNDDIDLAIVAWDGPPVAGAVRIMPYDLQFYGRRDRFATLEGITDEAELASFPIVQIEAKPGQPTLIDPSAPSFAMTQSLASVKTLVLAGFGVGALLDYMLDPVETGELVRANLPHEPDCALWAVRSPDWDGERPRQIEEFVVRRIRAAIQKDVE